MRRRFALALAAVLAAGSPAAAAAGPVELVAGVGSTLAVEGGPGGGGVALSLAVLWPVEDHFRVGLVLVNESLGERTERLVGPGGLDLGPIAGIQRSALGAALRVEGHLPAAGRLRPYLSASWGLYRVDDDVRGARVGRDEAAGFGLGAGTQLRFNDRHALGASVRAQQLSRGAAGRYLSAALEWRWGMGH